MNKPKGTHLNHHAVYHKLPKVDSAPKNAHLPRYIKGGKLVIGKPHKPNIGSN